MSNDITYVSFSPSMIRQDYFEWLCELVRIKNDASSFSFLMRDLFDTDFTYLIPQDANRVADGIELREEFGYYSDYDDYQLSYLYGRENSSVLEVLIALARRLAFQVIELEDDENDAVCQYFWEMVTNLGLDEYSDDLYLQMDGMSNVNLILNRWMNRDFDPDGVGSVFPLFNPPGDQRNIEIWNQMQCYINEVKEYV